MTLDREFIGRLLTAMFGRDRELLGELLHEDFVTVLPQSGERNKGLDGFLAEMDAYPDGGPVVPSTSEMHVVDDEERWAMSPGFTVVPLASPNEYTVTYRILYPGGQWWHVVAHLMIRDGKLYRMENYFAPELPGPLSESIANWSGS